MKLINTKRKATLAIVAALTTTLSAASLVAQPQPTTAPTAAPTTAPSRLSATVEAPSVLAAPVGGPLNITVNKSQVLTTRTPYTRVSVSQPEIADVNLVGPTSILLTAKKPGGTQIIIWDENNKSESIDVQVMQDLAVLQDQIKKMFPGAGIEVVGAGPDVALKGRVPNLQIAEQSAALAAPYGVKVLNFLEVAGGQQVMLQVRFAEVSRSAKTQLGFSNFIRDGSGFGLGTRNGPNGNPINALASGADYTLDPGISLFGTGGFGAMRFETFVQALRENNLARILAEPNLVAISGQEATFLAGGEFPIPVPQSSSGGGVTITVEFKEFGVRLKFVPVILGDGRIRLKVAPEVSDLDYANAITVNGFQIPAITKRSLNTTVEMGEGQTLALAGLLNNRVSANKSATPLLGDLPVIGALFRSVRYERNETELVVLVTPKLIAPMNPAQVPALPGEKWRHPNDVELMIGGDLGGPAGDAGKAAKEQEQAGPAPRYRGAYGFRDNTVKPIEPAHAETPAGVEPVAPVESAPVRAEPLSVNVPSVTTGASEVPMMETDDAPAMPAEVVEVPVQGHGSVEGTSSAVVETTPAGQ